MKKAIIWSIIFVVVITGVFIYGHLTMKKSSAPVSTEIQNSSSETLILFVSNGCPHCKNVEKFIEDNKVNEKLSIDQKEVSEDKNNAELLVQQAKKCGILPSEVGVPLLWNGSKCIVGDQDIISFLQTKIK